MMSRACGATLLHNGDSKRRHDGHLKTTRMAWRITTWWKRSHEGLRGARRFTFVSHLFAKFHRTLCVGFCLFGGLCLVLVCVGLFCLCDGLVNFLHSISTSSFHVSSIVYRLCFTLAREKKNIETKTTQDFPHLYVYIIYILPSVAKPLGHWGLSTCKKGWSFHLQVSLRFCLHTAMIFFGDADTVSCLLQAEADINEQLRIPVAQGAWWSLLKMLHFKHYLSPSVLTSLAYHHYGATPLMFSILTGKFEATATLVANGANLDLRNARGKTAKDLLKELDLDYPLSLTLEADLESEASDATISI